ncbi:MAG: isoprenylcysteine carboxylmethyltransferase family protein [Anaerolineaceae bacterium]|nr:isoprenylcysteine carboxylmethyltransferase family protein [Anaerolineaceae bacterium]NTV35733.1 isoprenylcysteine carboxylmethyltransferase family protein [Anaerolineaceae bacterium]
MSGTGFWWILLACIVYGAVHSILASYWAKRVAEGWFGKGVHRWYRLFFSLQGGILFLPILVLVLRLPDQMLYQIGFPWVVLSGFLQILGTGIVIYAIFQTGLGEFIGLSQAFGFSTVDSTQAPKLVISGLYRWVRHPIYTGSLLVIWLLAGMSWNVLAFNLGLTAYLIVGIILEERKLRVEFGAQYDEYARRTPMLIPGLRFRK